MLFIYGFINNFLSWMLHTNIVCIAISGKRRSGKTTYAYKLANEKNTYVDKAPVEVYFIIHFADEVKKQFADSIHNTVDFIESNKELFRKSIIKFAQNAKLKNQHIWVDSVTNNALRACLHHNLRKLFTVFIPLVGITLVLSYLCLGSIFNIASICIQALLILMSRCLFHSNFILIIPDLRFRHEVSRLNSLGKYFNAIYTVRINVTDDVRAARGWRFDEKIDLHDSEVDLDGYNFEKIINS